MTSPLSSLIETGTKLWLDSIDPDLVVANRKLGATGATSNPVIVADLIKTGRFDARIETLIGEGLDNATIAWQVTDELVRNAQHAFESVWQQTRGNDGYVSFELDPLLEESEQNVSLNERVSRYIQLGKQWSAGHTNRMIKVPATTAGLASLEELAAAGVTLNVTLIFTADQYQAARDAVWAGAQRRSAGLDAFKSVYSIFVSRIDVYTAKHVTNLSQAAQGQVGIVNAKRIWQDNQTFWKHAQPTLEQEIIFASTGTKNPKDSPWKYVEAFAGSDIQTNPPATNDAVAESGLTFSRQVDQLPPQDVLNEIDTQVDFADLHRTLMDEGIHKFADPQKELLALIAAKRETLSETT